jgi:hypothetical protein
VGENRISSFALLEPPSFSFIAFGCSRLPHPAVGDVRWDVLTRFLAYPLHNSVIVVFRNTSRFLCREFSSRHLLGASYPLACHRDGTHTPVEYALHPWFIPSDVDMTHEASQTVVRGTGKSTVLVCFTVLAAWMESLGRCEYTRKRHGEVIVHRETISSYRLLL